MVNFIAKRSTGVLKLYADGFHFGSLKDCEVTWLFECDDEMLEAAVNDKLEGDMSVSEMLAVAKAAYLGILEYEAEVSKAEAHAEGAYLRAAEYDPEALAEMEMEDAMG